MLCCVIIEPNFTILLFVAVSYACMLYFLIVCLLVDNLIYLSADVSGGKDLQTASMCSREYGEHNRSGADVVGVSGSAAHAYPDAECAQLVPGNNLAPPAMLQFAKTRKLSIERSDMRK